MNICKPLTAVKNDQIYKRNQNMTKTDVQLNPNISRMKNDRKFTGSSEVLCLQQISKEKLEFTFECWLFSLFCSLAPP